MKELILSLICVIFFIIILTRNLVYTNCWMGKHVQTDAGPGVVVDTHFKWLSPNTLTVRLQQNLIDAQRTFLETELKPIP